MTAWARFERHGEVGLVHLRAAAGTGLTAALRAEILRALEAAEADSRVGIVVLLAEGGALAGLPQGDDGTADPTPRALADRLESFAKPLLGALDGAAFDAGLELLLACPQRVAVRRSRLGFPAAALGRVPDAGATQRLPRLTGAAAALGLLVSGRVMEAPEAAGLGLLDAVEKEPLAGSAVSAARRRFTGGGDRPPRVRERPAGGDVEDVRHAAERLRDQGAPAPVADRLAAAVTAAVDHPFDEGLRVEADLASAARADPAVAALHHLAAARDACRTAAQAGAAEGWPLGSVAVVGAGVVGSALAILCAEEALPVMLVDRDPLALSGGLGLANDHFTRQVEEAGLDERDAVQRIALIQHSTKLREVAHASLVIEAVTDDPEAKAQVFRELGSRCRPRAVLAAAAAGPDLDALAEGTGCPAQVLGLRFVPPVLERAVAEIAPGTATAPEAVRTAAAAVARLGRVPVVVGAGTGFMAGRLLEAVMREAWALVEEGADPAAVDAALVAAGFAHGGVFALNDRLGVDGGWRVRASPEGSDPDRLRPAAALPARMAAAGLAGLGTLHGWYRWRDARPRAVPEPDDAWRAHLATTEPRTVAAEEAVARLTFTLVNQAAVLLDQGAALRPADADMVAVDATGFPATWGGPLFHADRLGLPAVVERLRALEAAHGASFHPAPLLVRLADKGRCFAAWEPGL